MANNILAKLAVEVSANNAKFGTALAKSQRDLSKFTNEITNLAKTVGVAFGVRELARFGVEITKLAGQAEAVGNAFNRLPNSVRLMSDLRKATHGTVNELDLMKRAVQASNFDISLQALPRLLEFATLRAQQTGQSVDYLVDSIVTGIGRKSKLILDNLGISAVQLDKALGGVSIAAASVGDVADAVGKIAEDNLKNMAAFAETADTKIQRLSASWDDLKTAMGGAAANSGVVNNMLNNLTRFFRVLGGDEFTEGFNNMVATQGRDTERLNRLAMEGVDITRTWQELLAEGYAITERGARKYEKVLKDIAEQAKNQRLSGAAQIDPLTGLPLDGSGRTPWNPSMIRKQITSLESLRAKEKELVEQFAAIDTTDKQKLQNKANEIIAIRDQIKAIEDLLKVEEKYVMSRAGLAALSKGADVTAVKPFGEIITRKGLQQFEGIAGTKTPLSDAIQVDIEKMAEMAQKMVELRNESMKTKTEMVQHWVDVSGALTSATATIADGLGAAVAGVRNFGESIVRAMTGFMGQFGEMLIATGFGALALQKLITNPYAAIAAGAALVALAGAANASLNEATQDLTSGKTSSGRSASRAFGSNNIGGVRNQGVEITLGGSWEIAGDKLVYIFNRAKQLETRTRG